MRAFVRFLSALMVLGVLLGGHGQADAQPSSGKAAARAHAMRGVALYKRRQYERALEYLQKAEQAFHAPTHVLFMARCKRELGQLNEAHDLMIEVLIDAVASDAPAAFARAVEQARDEAAKLRQKIATVIIEVEGAKTEEIQITLDGEVIDRARIEFPIAITDGEHVVGASEEIGGIAERTISGRVGVTQAVTLTLVPDDGAELYAPVEEAEPDEPPPPPPEPAFHLPLWPTVTTGAGAGVLLIGAILGGVTLSEAGDIKDQCQGNICPTELASDGDSAESMGHAATALIVIGSVAAAAGATWLTFELLSDSSGAEGEGTAKRLSAEVGPASARLRLAW